MKVRSQLWQPQQIIYRKLLVKLHKFMLIKISFGLLWVGFISYAFLLAPADQPHTLELIKNLSTGNFQGINTFIIA
jgi:hypothetical protein